MSLARRRRCALWVACLLVFSGPAVVFGQEEGGGSYEIRVHRPDDGEEARRVQRADPVDLYRGIVPQERDDLPHLQGARRNAERGARNEITWIGFQPQAGRTRVFVQTARTPRYRVERGVGTVIVVFEDTAVSIRNFQRFIDTSYFESSVLRIETERSGSDARVVLSLADGAGSPELSVVDGYLYMDFPEAGGAIAEEPAVRESELMASAEEQAPARSAPPPPPPRRPVDDGGARDEGRATGFAALDDGDGDRDRDRDREARIEEPEVDEEALAAARSRIGLGRGLVIGGLALAAGGGGLALYAERSRRVVTGVPQGEVVPISQVEAEELQDRTNRMDTVAVVMVGVGAVAAITGGVLWRSGINDRDRAMQVSVTEEGATVLWVQRF